MLYVKIDSQGIPVETPITLAMLKSRLPNVMLPADLTNDSLSGIGYACVPTEAPPTRMEGHSVGLSIPERLEDGTYKRTYVYIPYSEEGLQKRISELRSKRDILLAESDWVQATDVQDKMTSTQKAEWSEYRAALRNMPTDYSDPNMAVFPAMPDAPIITVNTKDLLESAYRKIKAKREDVQNAGLVYEFPDGTSGVIQTRNDTDLQNINGQVTASLVLIQSGSSDTQIYFKDEENVEHAMTPTQIIQMGMSVISFVSGTYRRKWEVETLVEAMSADELEVFDVEAIW